MIPLGKVFRFFKFDDNPQIPVGLLFGADAFVGSDHKLTWAEFACCAFYARLRKMGWRGDRVVGICQIVYPEIKKNVAGIEGGKVYPLIVLIIDGKFMLLGDNLLYDMKTWREANKTEFEEKHAMFQYSVCFMVSAIVIMEARRFLKKEPKYARGCPFVE